MESLKQANKNSFDDMRAKLARKEKEINSYYEGIESENLKSIESLHKIVSAKQENLKSNEEFLKTNLANNSNIGLLEFYAENNTGIKQQIENDNEKLDYTELSLPIPSSESQKRYKESLNSVIESINQMKPIGISESDSSITKSAKKNGGS